MYYIAISVIVILCGGYVNGECKHAFYSNPTVNAPVDFNLPQDCQQWKELGINKSDIYPVNPDGEEPFQVYCDMETDGGGWTVIQRRMDGSVDFNRDWTGYEEGFGNLNFEFWLGLSEIYRLIQGAENTELEIKLTDFEGETSYARYSTFSIGDSSTDYTLTLVGYSGTAGDGLSASNNVRFSTRDNDNDQSGDNCATVGEGGWWYTQCTTDANLNGLYHDSSVIANNSASWYPLKNNKESLKYVEMKIRPAQQKPIATEPPPELTGRDCKELQENGASTSGIYTINPDEGESFKVYCDVETDSGGWTVFQRRLNGSVDFYLGWDSYQEGFGTLDAEHWLGLDKLHRLTASGGCSLRIELENYSNLRSYVKYSTFQVANAASLYRLTIAGFSGDETDRLTYHNGNTFSTKDQDNDMDNGRNCATTYTGAWWYRSCYTSNLNGVYGNRSYGGIQWTSSGNNAMRFTEMKLRCN